MGLFADWGPLENRKKALQQACEWLRVRHGVVDCSVIFARMPFNALDYSLFQPKEQERHGIEEKRQLPIRR